MAPHPASSTLSSHLDALQPKLLVRQAVSPNAPTLEDLDVGGVMALTFGLTFSVLFLFCCVAKCRKSQRKALRAPLSARAPSPISTPMHDQWAPPRPPPPLPIYRTSMEMEMGELARPTAAAVGALGRTGSGGVPIGEIPIGRTNAVGLGFSGQASNA